MPLLQSEGAVMIAVEKRIKEDLASGHIKGASVHVSRWGKTLYEAHFGNVTENTLFRLASMTKPVTAVAVLILADRKKLSLKDPVIKYLPGFPLELQIIHLLSHTSGLSQSYYAEHITDEYRADANLLVDYIASVPFDHDPGTHAEYNAVAAFALLTAIVEKVANMDFATFAEKEIFEPLGMTDTTFLPTKEQWARLTPMDDTVPGCIFERYPVTNPLGGAGLVSSLADYVKFSQMLLNKGGNILSPEAVKTMSTAQFGTWGCGVRVVGENNRLPKGSFGWSGAYGTHFWIDPTNGILAIYMKNSRKDGGAGAKTAAHFEEDVYASL